MGKLISISLLLLMRLTVYAESADTAFIPPGEKSIPGAYKNFYVDNFSNIYLISTGNQIKKLDEHLDSVAVFNDLRRYGDVYALDVNNPLKIAVYYKDYTTLVILDRFLNTRNTIDLRNSGILQAKAIAQSYDNNYWVFDELNSKLKKIDDNGNVLLESNDFRMLFNYTYNPQYIIDADGALYLYDENKGWLIFDYYGAYKKHIDILHLKNVSVSKGVLAGQDSTGFISADTKTFSEKKQEISADFYKAVKVVAYQNKVFVLQKDKLIIYQSLNP